MISRRKLLQLAGAAVVALACSDGQGQQEMHNEPWLLWGQTSAVTLTGIPATGTSVTTDQLVSARYKRPDTWSFYFALQITNIANTVPVAVRAEFDVTLGLGRNTITIPAFCVLEIPPAELTQGNQPMRWATQVEHQAAFVGQLSNNITDKLTAQSIVINARFFSEGSINNGNTLQANLTAMVAPLTHIRPDWYADPRDKHEMQFSGETKGR